MTKKEKKPSKDKVQPKEKVPSQEKVKSKEKASSQGGKELGFFQKPQNVQAVAYAPYFIGPAIAYFLGDTSDRKSTMHHIKYSSIMALVAIVLIVLLKGFFASIVALGYLGISIYFAFKAYTGEAVQVEILDTIEDKISEKVGK